MDGHASTVSPVLSVLYPLCLVLLMLAGAGMQAFTNETIFAFHVAFLFLVAGVSTVLFMFRGSGPELRAFLLTYGVCLSFGGLAQWYSLAAFGNLQSTIDAHTFFRQISPGPPFRTMADLPSNFNSPLAVLVWQQLYKMAWWLGFDFGPYIAVMFNALVMGVTGGVTVLTARELFGNDTRRLRRVGTLFAFCGLFILFGAVLLRDCFTTFFNVLTFWGLVRWLCRPTIRNLLIALGVTCISAYAIAYLRYQSIVLFPFYWFMAILLWLFAGQLNLKRLVAMFLIASALFMGASHFMKHIQVSHQYQSETKTHYAGKLTTASQSGSLGMRLVVHQPMPIRMVLGSGYLMVFPIPLWGYLREGSRDYHLFKFYHGLYQMIVIPLVFAGFIVVCREYFRGRKQLVPFLFLVAYLLINFEAVVATTLEQRHLAQFMSAFVILAAIPDTREPGCRKFTRMIALLWFGAVVLIHLAWMLMK